MKHIRLFLLATVVFLLFSAASCEKSDNGFKVTYYKTVGEGYVYDGVNNKPIKGAKIVVHTVVGDGSGSGMLAFGPSTIRDTFSTNENGYYQVRFIKKAYDGVLFGWNKATIYSLIVPSDLIPPPPPPNWRWVLPEAGGSPFRKKLYPKDIEKQKNITIDTIKFYPYPEYTNPEHSYPPEYPY